MRHSSAQIATIFGYLVFLTMPASAQTQKQDASTIETPRTVTMAEQESSGLLFKTLEGGRYLPAPTVETHVEMEISGLVARVQVSQVFYNPTDQWLEGVYVYPLPENSAVDRMRMQIGDRYIEGIIEEKEKAKQIYEQAKSEGKKAALVEQQRPNIFTNSVANIGPSEDIIVQIEFQQTLHYDHGAFDIRFPMVVGPRYIPGTPQVASYSGTGWSLDTDTVPDASQITPPVMVPDEADRNPVTIDIWLDAGFPLADLDSLYHDIDVEELEDGVRHITLADDTVRADRDFVLEWVPRTGDAPGAGLFQETLGGEQYLLAMVMPPNDALGAEETQPREVIFIIDTSGSMGGPSIAQARDALALSIARLRPQDSFNIIDFDDQARRLFEVAMPASAANQQRASRYVYGLDAGGGTNMMSALEQALDGGDTRGRIRQVIFLTDGAVGNETELFTVIGDRLGDSRLFTVGIGSAPNSYFMSKAAELGHGTFTHIGSVDEVSERMGQLFAKLEHPVLTDIEAIFDGSCHVEMWPETVPDLYQGEPVMIAVAVAPDAAGAECQEVQFNGQFNGTSWTASMPLQGGGESAGVAAVWANAKIDSLMASVYLGAHPDEVRQQVTAVALEHSLVSQYTSLVAVDVTPSRPEGEEVHTGPVPVNLPAGWEADGVFSQPPTSRLAWNDTAERVLASSGDDGLAQAGLATAYSTTLPAGATASRLQLTTGALALLAIPFILWTTRRRSR